MSCSICIFPGTEFLSLISENFLDNGDQRKEYWYNILRERNVEGLPWQSSGQHFDLQCMESKFDPWLGSSDCTCVLTRKPKHKTKAFLYNKLQKGKQKQKNRKEGNVGCYDSLFLPKYWKHLVEKPMGFSLGKTQANLLANSILFLLITIAQAANLLSSLHLLLISFPALLLSLSVYCCL